MPEVDQRKQPRFNVADPAHVTLLGERKKRVAGCVLNVSGHGLKLMLAEPAPAGTALMVEWADAQLLGEVCYSIETQEGYAIGVKIEHALMNTAELERLARRLLGEPEPESIQVRITCVEPEP